MAYATEAELTTHLGYTPANAQQLLDRASRDVDRALLCAVYDPNDPAVVAALREATLEQVAGLLAAGDSTGLGSNVQSFTLGRLSVTRTQGSEAAVRPGQLHPQAYAVLQAAGLTGHAPQT